MAPAAIHRTLGGTGIPAVQSVLIITAYRSEVYRAISRILTRGEAKKRSAMQVIAGKPVYIRRLFKKEPDFRVTSVNYDLADLVVKGVR